MADRNRQLSRGAGDGPVRSDQTGPAHGFFTPSQIAERYEVGVGRVIDWIKSGRLRAVNVSVSVRSKKPQYRVSAAALEQFEQSRTTGCRLVRPPRRQPYPQLV